jgi:type VII secretion integral membrane protein EccD
MASAYRVTVQTGDVAVDLTLPAGIAVGVLIPSIVDIVNASGDAGLATGDWQLSRPGGPSLDESTTLTDNGIRDGDLLVLSTIDTPPPTPIVDDPFHAVVSAAAAGHDHRSARAVATGVFVWVAATSAATLLWSGVRTEPTAQIVTSAAVACAAAVAAVVGRRTADALSCVTLGVAAIAFTAAVGFLVVPGGPGAPNLCLAAAAGGAAAVLLLRVIGCGTVCFIAVAAFAAMATTTAAAATVSSSVQTVGAGLAAASVGLLSLAARAAIAAARLSPAGLDDEQPELYEARADNGHNMLTGLVIGIAGAATLGAVLVASNTDDVRSGVAFITVVGVALLLRARSHVDMGRIAALVAFGTVTVTAAFALFATSAPQHAGWVGAVAATAAVTALPSFRTQFSPLAGRGMDWLEYVALAAIVPLACWVGDLYGIVRGLGLS